MWLDRVTMTGIDDEVEMSFIDEMTAKYGFVEWGVLLSESRQGDSRYPSNRWLAELTSTFYGKYDHNFAGHFCGKLCDRLIITSGEDYLRGDMIEHSQPNFFSRIQLNSFPDGEWTVGEINLLSSKVREVAEIILPVSDLETFDRRTFLPTINFLCDSSRGRGIKCDKWPTISDGRVIGFAGGIDPDNVRSVLDELCRRSGEQWFWIDMESGVRTDDRFDYKKAETVLDIVSAYI